MHFGENQLSRNPSHPEFPSTVLRAGKVFRATTTLRFFTGKQCGKL